jgi:hypothetical protein
MMTMNYPSSEIQTTQEPFSEWALLELFGHQRLAGRVTEQQIGGASFVRVDVPEDGKKKGWKLTRHYNPSAIYSITPITEQTCRMLAQQITAEPVTRWDVQEMVRDAKRALKPAVDAED